MLDELFDRPPVSAFSNSVRLGPAFHQLDLVTADHEGLARDVGGMIGAGSKVSEGVSELFPMIDVENVPGELLLLGGTEMSMGSHINIPGAANAAQVQLFNVVGSGKIVTITKVIFSISTGAATARLGISDTAIGTATNAEEFRDSRRPAASKPASQMRFFSDPTPADPQLQIGVFGNVPYTLDDPNGVCVLSPGFGLHVGLSALNVTLICSFLWRERVAEQSELQF